MPININIHIEGAPSGDMAEIRRMFNVLITKDDRIMADLSELTAEVEANTAVDQSAITLLNGLAAQIEALATDPAALRDLASTLRGSSGALAAAVAANTPASPDA